MVVIADRADQLLQLLAATEGDRLVALAEQARRRPEVPAFRGRCLEPAYLQAVARGEWTVDDELVLEHALARAAAEVLPRVGWRHRRALRRALAAAAVAVLTEQVTDPTWQRTRRRLASGWTRTLADRRA